MIFDETPQRFDFADQQRLIPLGVRLRLRFGGIMSQLGWFLLGVGSILFWMFALQADVTSWYVFRGPLATAPGKVLSSTRTSFSSGKSRRTNGPSPNRIYAHRYQFVDDQSLTRTGVSYARGAKDLTGQEIVVEYPLDDPTHSRIQKMRPTPLDAPAAVTALVPLIGLVLLAWNYLRSGRALRLLSRGAVANAKLVYSTPTHWKINNRRVDALHFRFVAGDGCEYQKTIRTHEPHLYQGSNNRLLYDPGNPANAELLQRMPGPMEIDARGEIVLPHPIGASFILILPLLVTIGNAAYVMMLA